MQKLHLEFVKTTYMHIMNLKLTGTKYIEFWSKVQTWSRQFKVTSATKESRGRIKHRYLNSQLELMESFEEKLNLSCQKNFYDSLTQLTNHH